MKPVIYNLCDITGSESGYELLVSAGQEVELVDSATSLASAHIKLVLEQDARATYKGLFMVSAGLLERTIAVECRAPGAHAAIKVACQTSDTAEISIKTIQWHAAPHTTSDAVIVGVSEDKSKASVLSTIHIERGAFSVVAEQEHRHLLLNKGARVVSTPALDILSNDVSCRHGSAISHLDQQQLFYLQSRGYGDEEARSALVKAFLSL